MLASQATVMPACRRKKKCLLFSQIHYSERKTHSIRLIKKANKPYSKLECCISLHMYSSSINRMSKTPTRGRDVFFSTFLTILYWEIDSFWSKKVSFGSHERKILLNKL